MPGHPRRASAMLSTVLARVVIVAFALGIVVAVVEVVSEWPRPVDSMTRATPEPAQVVDEHFALDDPAVLDDAEAEAIYQRLRDRMRTQFALSGVAAAAAYQDWTRRNRVPYRSATHGERFVNNFTNEAASSYGSGAAMPVGAIIAKDAFTVTGGGEVHTAALALMEKMAPGFDPDGNDWRYVLIMPEGDIFGTTNGAGDEQVGFCRDCHRAVAEKDFLFLVPDAFRPGPHAAASGDPSSARQPVTTQAPQGDAR